MSLQSQSIRLSRTWDKEMQWNYKMVPIKLQIPDSMWRLLRCNQVRQLSRADTTRRQQLQIKVVVNTTEQTTGGIQGKPRAAPFIKEEDRTLREAYAKHIHVIKGKVKDGVTMDDKKGAWRQIVECVNAVSKANRDVAACKQRWNNMNR
ncbi:myb/SANT-like DNA-binding domain-containing protein [Ditylenchus destructor]|uniref:Regulatory protein zeste n=1 Tax=Ditylenchus destructor TaxID=166010 RepID=A0AAD4N7F6_9BILA|nr:myb/SANT-like DNA-binding domain-containing protein [Ditylenchus destructor]